MCWWLVAQKITGRPSHRFSGTTDRSPARSLKKNMENMTEVDMFDVEGN